VLDAVEVIDPLPYDEMLQLLVKARLVITDSGGLQEECSFFNKKCLVCRIVTERPEAVGKSSFIVAAPDNLHAQFKLHHESYEISAECPYGDGHSSERIAEILKNYVD
jgi:UDP-N-acetylglucosamine 2-epimerase (non-hydrolysing)